MACDPTSANIRSLVSRNAFHRAIADALGLYVGRGRRYSVRELSEATGVPERQLECAKIDPEGAQAEDWRPLKAEELASLTKFLGVSFASAFLAPCGLGAFELMDGQPPLPKVLCRAEPQMDVAEERKRLIRRLAELEGVQ
jgi:hypothetical protein